MFQDYFFSGARRNIELVQCKLRIGSNYRAAWIDDIGRNGALIAVEA